MTPTSVAKDGILFTDSKLLDLSMEDAKIQTLSYDVDDDDDWISGTRGERLHINIHV